MTVAAKESPTQLKVRAEEIVRILRKTYPHARTSLDYTNPLESAGGDDPLGPGDGCGHQQDHARPVRQVPHRGRLRQCRHRRAPAGDQGQRLLPPEIKGADRRGKNARGEIRWAGARHDGGSAGAALGRPQDGQRGAFQRLRQSRGDSGGPSRGPCSGAVGPDAKSPTRSRSSRISWPCSTRNIGSTSPTR